MLGNGKGSWFVVHPSLIIFSLLCSFLSGTSLPLSAATPASHKTQHVLFVMTDGLRWQEVFRGADPALLHQKNET
jgi:hypothetical protein